MTFSLLIWILIAGLATSVATALLAFRKHAAPPAPVTASPEATGEAMSAPAPEEADIAVYKQQLAAVKADRDRGTLSAAEAKALEADISRRLLRAAGQPLNAGAASAAQPPAKNRTLLYNAIVATLIAAAIAVYAGIGNPSMPGVPYATRTDVQPTADQQLAQLDQMVQLLPKTADTAAVWASVGERFLALQSYARAEQAFRTAIDLTDPTPGLWNNLGAAIVFQHKGPPPPEAVDAFQHAVALDPNDAVALYFLGLDAQFSRDFDKARDLFTRSLAHTKQDNPLAGDARKRLKQLSGNGSNQE